MCEKAGQVVRVTVRRYGCRRARRGGRGAVWVLVTEQIAKESLASETTKFGGFLMVARLYSGVVRAGDDMQCLLFPGFEETNAAMD